MGKLVIGNHFRTTQRIHEDSAQGGLVTVLACFLLVCSSSRGETVERPAGDVEVVHRVGELLFDAPVAILSGGGDPTSIATIDGRGDGLSDPFHDLVIGSSSGVYLLEARPTPGDITVRNADPIQVGFLPSTPPGQTSIASFFTHQFQVEFDDTTPDVLLFHEGLSSLCAFRGDPSFAGSGGRLGVPLFINPEGLCNALSPEDPDLLGDVVDLAVGGWGPDQVTTAAVVGSFGTLFFLRFGNVDPDEPSAPVFDGTVDLAGIAVSVAHLPADLPRFAVLGTFLLDDGSTQAAVHIIEHVTPPFSLPVEIAATFPLGEVGDGADPLQIETIDLDGGGQRELV